MMVMMLLLFLLMAPTAASTATPAAAFVVPFGGIILPARRQQASTGTSSAAHRQIIHPAPPSHPGLFQRRKRRGSAAAVVVAAAKEGAKGNEAGGDCIAVAPITSMHDVRQLADLRYDEWILPASDAAAGADGREEKIPSRQAFRAATCEIFSERQSEGAATFLARLASRREQRNGDAPGESTASAAAAAAAAVATNDAAVVGAAELSPIETKVLNRGGGEQRRKYLYVTDVVTSRSYRRRGVARAMMRHLEQHALREGTNGWDDGAKNNQQRNANADTGVVHLLLHVLPSNAAAIEFYEKLGYRRGADDPLLQKEMISPAEINLLAESAGTVGQLLMVKALHPVDTSNAGAAEGRRRAASGSGFGGGVNKRRLLKKRR